MKTPYDYWTLYQMDFINKDDKGNWYFKDIEKNEYIQCENLTQAIEKGSNERFNYEAGLFVVENDENHPNIWNE